jgi:uncharacterized protein (DUF58 family)
MLTTISLATGHAPSAAGASILGAVLAVGFLGAAWASRRLHIVWTVPDRGYAGEVVPLEATVVNEGGLPLSGVAFDGSRIAQPRQFDSEEESHRNPFVAPLCNPGNTAFRVTQFRLRHRGRLQVRVPTIVVAWPFGLARCVLASRAPASVLAYPRRLRKVPRLPQPRSASAPRDRVTPFAGGGDRLRGVREWRPGDPPRSVAWRASARHGRLLAREFEREEEGPLVLLLDASGPSLEPLDRAKALDRACSLACSLLLRARAEGRAAAFGVHAQTPIWVPSVASGEALARALEALALVRPVAPRRDAPSPTSLLPPRLARNAEVVVLELRRGAVRRGRAPGGQRVLGWPFDGVGYEPVTSSAIEALVTT